MLNHGLCGSITQRWKPRSLNWDWLRQNEPANGERVRVYPGAEAGSIISLGGYPGTWTLRWRTVRKQKRTIRTSALRDRRYECHSNS